MAALISLTALFLDDQKLIEPLGKFLSSDLNLLLDASDNGMASSGIVLISLNSWRNLLFRRNPTTLLRIVPIRYRE